MSSKNPTAPYDPSDSLWIYGIECLTFEDSWGSPSPTQILIKNGIIEKILRVENISLEPPHDPESKTWNAEGLWVTPGLINSHTHAALNFLKGYTYGNTNMIADLFFTTESNLTHDLTKALAGPNLIEMLKSGTTTICDHYYFSDAIAEQLDIIKMRGFVAETLADLGGAKPSRDMLKTIVKSIENWSFSDLVKPMIGPHATDTVSAEYLNECGTAAKHLDLNVHMHFAQLESEKQTCIKRNQCTPLEIVESAGLLSERTQLVHALATNKTDIEHIKDAGSFLGYCPVSQTLYDHVADLPTFLNSNASVCLATDCASSNDSMNLFQEMKYASLVYKHTTGDILSNRNVFNMVSTTPAEWLKPYGLKLGTIEDNAAADLVFYKPSASIMPSDHALHNLIFSNGSYSIPHVMVNGEFSVWNEVLVHANEEQIDIEYMKAIDVMKTFISKIP